MEIKIIAKNTFILAGPKVLNFIVGILKSKLIAVYLGTTGFGIIEQLTNTINSISGSILAFMPDGMVKLIAQERSGTFSKKVIAEIIKTYFLMVIPLTTVAVVLAFLFSDQITIFVFGDIQYKSYYLFGIIAIPITFFVASFSSILKAFKEIKSFAIAEVYIMIINLIAFVPLIYYFGVTGGIVYVIFSFFSSLMVFVYLARKNVFKKYGITLAAIKNAVFSNTHAKELLAFIGVGMIAGVFKTVENMASRALLVNHLGIEKIGIYAPITKWQSLFLSFIMSSVFMYLYPRISESRSNQEITSVINDVIRLVTFLTLPFVILAIATRQWIIPLFYSTEFLEAGIYLPYHFGFLLFAVWAIIFEHLFAPTGRLKVYLIFVIVINSLSLLLVYLFIPKYGLYGYLLRFTVTPLFSFIIFFIYLKKEISFKIKPENLKIMAFTIFSCTLLIIFRDSNYFLQLIIAAFLLISMIFLMGTDERKYIVQRVKKILPKS